jgi:methanogenic corrinoid protein MtbC1
MSDISQQCAEALRTRQADLAGVLVERQFERHPELAARYGAIGRQRCLEDAQFHLSFLAQAVQLERAEIFGEYIAWAKVMLSRRGIPAEDLARHLALLREILVAELPGEVSAFAAQAIDRCLVAMPQMPLEIPSFLDSAAPLADLARDYLGLLLRGDRQRASQRILAAAQSGTPVRLIYLEVFQRAQREVGLLWQTNEITVAQEHYCTAATQMIMSQLYPLIFTGEKSSGTLVATSVAGDLHEIGVRMVSDLFEMDGWNTYYLGASTPAPAIVQALVERRAQILAISATLAFHVAAVQSLVAQVRASAACRAVKILVGGYPFNLTPGLWREIGADGHARDADAAIALARRLVNSA